MTEYDAHRRTPKVPRLNHITKNEAAEGSELRRLTTWVRAREALADELRKQQRPARSFAELIKKK